MMSRIPEFLTTFRVSLSPLRVQGSWQFSRSASVPFALRKSSLTSRESVDRRISTSLPRASRTTPASSGPSAQTVRAELTTWQGELYCDCAHSRNLLAPHEPPPPHRYRLPRRRESSSKSAIPPRPQVFSSPAALPRCLWAPMLTHAAGIRSHQPLHSRAGPVWGNYRHPKVALHCVVRSRATDPVVRSANRDLLLARGIILSFDFGSRGDA